MAVNAVLNLHRCGSKTETRCEPWCALISCKPDFVESRLTNESTWQSSVKRYAAQAAAGAAVDARSLESYQLGLGCRENWCCEKTKMKRP